MVNVISRKDWGASAGDGNGERPVPASESYVHHSVTKHLSSSASKAEESAQMRVIERIGVQRFGSHYGFPYTFAIFPSGRVYEGHDYSQRGAHTGGHNTPAIGICWVGNYETNRPTDAVIRSTAELLVQLRRAKLLTTSRLTGGHRDAKRSDPTACPGRYAYARLGDVRTTAARLEAGGSTPPPPPSPGTGVDKLGRYTVRSGDTLAEIAAKFRTSVAALVLLNGISNPDRIDVGDRLYTRWVVGRGDTLSEIADAAGTSVSKLVSLNGIRNADVIQIGQLIRLP